MRDYATYEQFIALCEQEARGSRSGLKKRRTYIPREREEAEQRLNVDYFGDDEFLPKYSKENFRRRYRISSTLFNKIVNDILSYDVQPLLEYFNFFRQRYDCTSRLSISPILKCTYAIRQLAYGTAPDAFDEYLQIAECCSRQLTSSVIPKHIFSVPIGLEYLTSSLNLHTLLAPSQSYIYLLNIEVVILIVEDNVDILEK
ncbi:hypothetical protein Tco_0441754 [Tanacetum coccineum]